MSVDTAHRTASAPLIPAELAVPLPPALKYEKTAVFTCGTIAPGLVHDPCQHSRLQVLCCDCAGCMFDLWSCGRESLTDSYLWYEAEVIAAKVDPWARHPYALMLYALVIIFLLSTEVVTNLLIFTFWFWVIVMSAGGYIVTSMFT